MAADGKPVTVGAFGDLEGETEFRERGVGNQVHLRNAVQVVGVTVRVGVGASGVGRCLESRMWMVVGVVAISRQAPPSLLL
jgi:hypothetical protein